MLHHAHFRAGARTWTLAVLGALCALAGGLTVSAPAWALRAHVFSGSFGAEGSGAGQFKEPEGIAVNDTTHDVYLADRANNRIDEFTSAGVSLGEFNGSTAPTGALTSPEEVAIDDSGNPLDPSSEDVYVVDFAHSVVDKFGPSGEYLGQITEAGGSPLGEPLGVAVDPNGVVWVLRHSQSQATDSIVSYSDALFNAFRSEIPAGGYGAQTIGHGIAVDANDDLYIDNKPRDGTLKLDSSGKELSQELLTGASPTGVAVDSSTDDVYIGEGNKVTAYGPNLRFEGTERGVPLEHIGAEQLVSSSGVGVDSASHTVYAADAGAGKILAFAEVLLPDVTTGETPLQEHEGSARLEGTVNPDGDAVTSCKFEYGTEAASLGSTAPCEPAPGSGSSPVAVHAVVSGLSPLSTYYYRLVAANANGSNPGVEQSFFAAKPPIIESESFVGVTANGATLHVQVNPQGADTTYRFEYGTTEAYGTSVSGSAGSAVGGEEFGAHIQGLQPSTTYHFRVVVASTLATVRGGDETLTTQSSGGEFTLPDGRAWEMVTPPDKHGAGLYAVGNEQGSTIQAASDGSALAYVTSGPLVTNPKGSRAPETTQIVSTRSAPGDWETADVTSPYNEGPTSLTLGFGGEYKLFANDLSAGVVQPNGYTALPPLPPDAEKTIYLRKANGEYVPLVTAANVPPGTKLQPPGEPNGRDIQFEMATPDLNHVILYSAVPLTTKAGDTGGIYEWSGGQLQKIGVLPGGGLTEGMPGTGGGAGQTRDSRNAISDDGSRVIWTTGNAQHLYMRDMVVGDTVQVDAAQGVAEPGADTAFQTASSDDSRVFFSSPMRLTSDSTAAGSQSGEGEDLYEFETTSAPGKPLAGKLTDLTVDPNAGEEAGLLGVIGASEDGSDVYFVARGVLGDAAAHHATRGANLYVEHYDAGAKAWAQPTFVAALSGGDYRTWGTSDQAALNQMTSRVSPNGRYLAFMSENSLTGYDNADASSGVPDEEVYLYDALAGRLTCASCDPTGARPAGVVGGPTYSRLADYGGLWTSRWFAANVPSWNTMGLDSALYQPRYLSNSGRLFFNSDDGLVPADVNGQEDVYEYEPDGVGSCQGADHGQSASIVYSAGLSGCVALISTGTSPEESAFMEASESGGDVFFLTTSRLAPQDTDSSYDIYDAHECTTAQPCAPAAASTLPPCTTGDACKPSPTPQPESFGAPSSETFSGAGNVTPAAPEGAPMARSLTRAQKLTAALRACRKRHRSRGRARAKCESQAQSKYGAKSSRKRVQSSRSRKGSSTRTGR